ELRGDDGRIQAFVRAISEPGVLADSAGYSPEITFEQKVELLETLDVTERLELAVKLQRERLAEMQVRQRIREDVGSIIDEYRTKIEEAGMPEDVREQADRELDRLERMGEQSGEASMIRTYLDWLTAVPWSGRSDERLD